VRPTDGALKGGHLHTPKGRLGRCGGTAGEDPPWFGRSLSRGPGGAPGSGKIVSRRSPPRAGLAGLLRVLDLINDDGVSPAKIADVQDFLIKCSAITLHDCGVPDRQPVDHQLAGPDEEDLESEVQPASAIAAARRELSPEHVTWLWVNA
jgi:hypothetical protein